MPLDQFPTDREELTVAEDGGELVIETIEDGRHAAAVISDGEFVPIDAATPDQLAAANVSSTLKRESGVSGAQYAAAMEEAQRSGVTNPRYEDGNFPWTD